MSASDPRAALELVTTPEAPGPLLIDPGAAPRLWQHPGDDTRRPHTIICVTAQMLCLDGSYTPPATMGLRSFDDEQEAVHVYQKFRNAEITAQEVVDFDMRTQRALPINRDPGQAVSYRKRLMARRRRR